MVYYRLTEENVRLLIPKGKTGVYKLGELEESNFLVHYVGRSDTDLQRRLLRHALNNRNTFFSFNITGSAKTAFLRECMNFHSFNDLTNAIHPASIGNMHCPVCEVNEHFESLARGGKQHGKK